MRESPVRSVMLNILPASTFKPSHPTDSQNQYFFLLWPPEGHGNKDTDRTFRS